MTDKVFTRLPQRRDLSNQRFSNRQTTVRPVTFVVDWSSPANHVMAGSNSEQLSELTENGGSESDVSNLPTPPSKSRFLRSRLASRSTTTQRVSNIQEDQEPEPDSEVSEPENERSKGTAPVNDQREEYIEERGDNLDLNELENSAQSEEAIESQQAEDSDKQSENRSRDKFMGISTTGRRRRGNISNNVQQKRKSTPSVSVTSRGNIFENIQQKRKSNPSVPVTSRGNIFENIQQKRKSTPSGPVTESNRDTVTKRRRTAEEKLLRETGFNNDSKGKPNIDSDNDSIHDEQSSETEYESVEPKERNGDNDGSEYEDEDVEAAQSANDYESFHEPQNRVEEESDEADESETENSNQPTVSGEVVAVENHHEVQTSTKAIRDNITRVNVKNRISNIHTVEPMTSSMKPSSAKKQNTLDMFFRKKSYSEVDNESERNSPSKSRKVLLNKIFSPQRRNEIGISEENEGRLTEEEIDLDINMSFAVVAESTPVDKRKKAQPKIAPRKKTTPRKQTPTESTNGENSASQSLYIWNGGVRGKKKGTSRVLDLDVILAMVEQIAGDYRAELKTVASRRAIREFFKEFQDEMTDLIDSVEEMNLNYSKYLKVLGRVRSQQKELMAAQDETRTIELEAYNIKKEIPKSTEGNARADLNRAKDLLHKYRQQRRENIPD